MDATVLPSSEQEALLEHVEWLATQLDEAFEIPGVGLKFGWEAIIGLIPSIGDVLMGLVSLYIVGVGWRLGLPGEKLAMMLGNVVVDVAVGMIPIAGDIFDFFFHPNARNVRLIREHFGRHVTP